MRIRNLFLILVSFAILNACSTSKQTAKVEEEKITKPKPVVTNGDLPEVKATSGEDDFKAEEVKLPVLTFGQPTVDFGTVKKGDSRLHSFAFTNTGNADLVIELVTACTCTSLDWPRKPIPPGGSGTIDVEFDSSSKDGMVTVDVDVIANTEPIVVTAVIRAAVIN